MIRMSIRQKGQRIVVLGLEPENLRRLQLGEPVRVNLRNLDPDGPPTDLPDVTVMIAATDTDDWRGFLTGLGVTDVPRRGPAPKKQQKVCKIPDCGCDGTVHP